MSHEIPRHWRLKDQRLKLEGEVCPEGHFVFPPRDICPNCHREAKKKVLLSGKGKVYSSTVIYEAPAGYQGLAPYQVALVKLDEGPMITAQLTDLHDSTKPVKIGTKVEMVTRKLRDNSDETGLIPYGYKFRVPIKSS